MRAGQAGAGDRRLFEFLAASRPDSERKGTATALAASLAGHGALIGLAIWATVAAADRRVSPREVRMREDFVVLLSPRQSLSLTKHAFAAATRRMVRDVPPGEKDADAGPSADPAAPSSGTSSAVRARVRILPLLPPPSPDPSPDIAELTRHADAVLLSLHESEYGGIGEDSVTTVASIVDDHHEPTADDLDREGPRLRGSFTSAPELANPEQVQRMLSRSYPSSLKDSGVGGRVLLWFLVDETGKVRRWLLKASSGHAALDKVAMRAAPLMRFRPGWNYDRHVPLWIVLPITFVVDAG